MTSTFTVSVSAAALLCVAVVGCGGAGACESGEGVALVFAPTRGAARDAEAMRPRVEALSKAQLVVGRDEVAVFIGGQATEPFADAKASVLAEARALGLEWTVEDKARIDSTCDVQLEHRESPVRLDRSR